MRKFIAMLLAVVLMFGVVGSAAAYDPRPFADEVKKLRASGKMSNDLITQAIIDLSFIESQGTVVATVYDSVYENKTVNTYTDLLKQPPWPCVAKLTHFVFELTNQYRLQETDLAISIESYDTDLTVSAYVYGQYKNQAMYALLTGVPDCLNNEPYSPPSGDGGSGSDKVSDGSSWIEPYSPEEIGTDPIESFQVTTFAIDEKTYTVAPSTTTDKEESIAPTVQTMDVAPYIKEDRTYVPVRYLAYSLGVAEDDVTWDGDARKVGISKEDTNISLIIGSPVMYVDKKPVKMDVAPEITNDRTFLPARWVAEALGAQVDWDETTKQAIVKIPVEHPGD